LLGVEIVEAAVSDHVGRGRLSLGSSDQTASLVHRDRGSHETAVVNTVTLDSEAARRGLAPDFVKIDVEGAELAVVRGMATLLREARPTIVCELHTDHPSFDDPVPAALKMAGYRLAWLEDGVETGAGMWAAHLVAVPT
jgi:hypothetical protein